MWGPQSSHSLVALARKWFNCRANSRATVGGGSWISAAAAGQRENGGRDLETFRRRRRPCPRDHLVNLGASPGFPFSPSLLNQSTAKATNRREPSARR